MKNILLSLTLFYAAVSVCAIVKALHEPFEQPGLVRLPKWLLLFGIPGTAIFLIVPWCTFGKINTATFAFALLLTFLPFSLTLAYLNCRVKYNDRTFMRRTLLGWRSTFCYEDITGICGWENTVTLYIGSRCVMLDRYALGRREFLEAAKTRYNQCYRRPIPAVRARSDIFRGNLKNPGEMLLCICLLLVFTLLFVPFTFLWRVLSGPCSRRCAFLPPPARFQTIIYTFRMAERSTGSLTMPRFLRMRRASCSASAAERSLRFIA